MRRLHQDISDGGDFHQSTTTGDGSGLFTADAERLLTNGAMISSNSLFGLGQGGNVTVQGLQGSGSPAASLDNSMISTIFSGGARPVLQLGLISRDTLALANDAAIGNCTVGAAPADIALNVDTLTASMQDFPGGAGRGSGDSGIASISSFTAATAGNAGHITIQGITGAGSPAATVSLDSSSISTTIVGGSTATTPAAITITAHTLALANQALILANTFGAAPAGDITLNVDTLTVGNSGFFLLPGAERREEGGLGDWLFRNRQ
jgi:hypothetical protein